MVLVILKSIASSKSRFPSTSSLHFISFGFICSFGSANRLLFAQNKCFIKYSCPFAELDTKLERQTNNERGKFSVASGTSIANDNAPDFNCYKLCLTYSLLDVFLCF